MAADSNLMCSFEHFLFQTHNFIPNFNSHSYKEQCDFLNSCDELCNGLNRLANSSLASRSELMGLVGCIVNLMEDLDRLTRKILEDIYSDTEEYKYCEKLINSALTLVEVINIIYLVVRGL